MSENIDKKMKKKIENLIGDIEAKSSVEVAVIITNSCDNYRYTTFLYSFLGALILPIVPLLFGYHPSNAIILNIMAVSFIALFFIIDSSTIKYLLPSKIIKKDRCDKMALANFYKMGIDKTKNRRALLIFVAKRERLVKIIADDGISSVISNDKWQEIVDEFIPKAKEGRFGDGILEILEKCKPMLIKLFPKDGTSEHKISNEVVEI